MAVEKDELDNLFTDSDKDELERLKVLLRDNRYGYYLATSVPVEVDWEMCKGYARETGVSDEYLTEANFNRAVEYALQKIALGYTSVGDCIVVAIDGLIHVTVETKDYEDTVDDDIDTIIFKLTLEKDDLGILRLYVSGEMQDELREVINYKEVIERVSNFIPWFKRAKEKVDTYIQEINAKIKNIQPSVMELFLNIVEADKNREWLNKKLEYAVELKQTVETYLKAKREMLQALENDCLQRLKIDTTTTDLFNLETFKGGSLSLEVNLLTAKLRLLQVGESSFSDLQEAETLFEKALKWESGAFSFVPNKIRSSLEKLLSEHSDNEKMAQEIEEVLALVKQPKVITAEEQLVSAWNKYISLRMEGKE